MDIQDAYSRPRQLRRRTVSLSSVTSLSSQIILDSPKASLANATVHARSYSVYGSFIPTPSARPSLDHLQRSSAPSRSFFSITRPPRLRVFLRHSWAEEDGDSPPPSGSTSPSIPSFSRTASPPPFPFPPHTWAPGISEPPVRPSQAHGRKRSCELDPILAKLERKSKLLTKKAYCATCKKAGSDYPKCGRCDDMWCSRACRMVGGKRHVCSSRV